MKHWWHVALFVIMAATTTNPADMKMKGLKTLCALVFLLALGGCSEVELPGDLEASQDHTGFASCKDSALPCTAMW